MTALPTVLGRILAGTYHTSNGHETLLNYIRQYAPAENPEIFLRHLNGGAYDATAFDTPDLESPMSHYFVSSSHNTYLDGHQLYGQSSIEPYQHALKNACRCIEIDVWDGVDIRGGIKPPASEPSASHEAPDRLGNDSQVPNRNCEARGPGADETDEDQTERVEPRVLHGHTATKAISFRKVCRAVRDTAFETSDLPVIVSLEVHTNPQQQQIMVDIMKQEWAEFLLKRDTIDPRESKTDAKLVSLRKRILIKVKNTIPIGTTGRKAADGHETDASSSSASSLEKTRKVPHSKIIPSLSRMAVYTRACRFHSFNQPEASELGHIFSLSEAKIHKKLANHDHSAALVKHNKEFLMRVYPKGSRIRSSNPDPLPFCRAGVQLVALNWQYVNKPMMLNHALFDMTAGWVRKPASLRPIKRGASDSKRKQESAEKQETGTLSLKLRVLAARGSFKACGHPYIRAELQLERAARLRRDSDASSHHAAATEFTARTESHGHFVDQHGDSSEKTIDFKDQMLEFQAIPAVVQDLSFLLVEMKNSELGKDALVAWGCVRWTRLKEKLRTLRMYDSVGKECGVLVVMVEKHFVVDPPQTT